MKMTTLRIVFAALVACSTVHLTDEAIGATFTKVYAFGDELLGFPGSMVVDHSTPRSINNLGQANVIVSLSGPGITTNDDTMHFAGPIDSLSLYHRENQQAPGFPPDVTFSGFPQSIRYGDDGRVLFWNDIAGPGIMSSDNTVAWIGSPGNLVPLMREGDPAPGLPGLTMSGNLFGSRPTHLTSTGKIFLHQELAQGIGGVTNSSDGVLYYGTSPADIGPIFREGDPAPGAPSGAIVGSIATNEAFAGGDYAFVRASMVEGQGGVTSTNDEALWVTDSTGEFKLALREEDVVTGLPGLAEPGTQFKTFADSRMNASGMVLHANASLLVDGVHVSSSNDRVAMVGSADSPFVIVAREGTQAPGLPAGVNYGGFFDDNVTAIADDGKIALMTQVTGPGITTANDQTFFYGMPDALQPILREGDQAPGFPAGTNFRSGSSTVVANDMFVALSNVRDGVGVTTRALFATNPWTGELELVIKRGDTLETAPGVFKEINSLDLYFEGSVNNRHQIMFGVRFADSSQGVYVANVGVPEPSAIILTGLACLGLVGAARRRHVSNK